MKKRFLFLLMGILILVGIIFLSSSVMAIPNPSAVYCEKIGYTYRIDKTPEGEKGICIVDSGVELKAWDFFKGKVGKQYSYCAKKGYDTKTEHIDKETYSEEYAVCVSKKPGEEEIAMHELMEKEGESLIATELYEIKQNKKIKYKKSIHSILKSKAIQFASVKTNEIESLPSLFDWRNISDHSYIGGIRDQGACGSCYAFGAAAAAEGTYNVAKNLTDENCINFSEAFIAFCLSDHYTGFDGCSGVNYEYEELDALTDEGIGVCDESVFPYTDHEQSCYAPAWDSPRIEFDSWSRIETLNIDAIKTAIMTYGVVDVAVYVDTSFQDYSGGIYSDSLTSCPDGYYTSTNHGVSLVGWGYDETYGDYWILRNSWNTNWGENGYMRITVDSARVACAPAHLEFGVRPKGKLQPYIIDVPSTYVIKDQYFNFSTGVRCVNGSCGNVSATLSLPQSQPTTCSEIWGFSCRDGPPEDDDNTFDSCGYGAGQDESINEIYLDKSELNLGEPITVTCYVDAKKLPAGEYYPSDDFYIYYRNSPSGTWVQKYAVTENVYPDENYSVTFVPDSVEGEHQVRCIIDYDPENDECAGGEWYDNDDANFSVHNSTTGKGKVPMDYGNPFYTINQNPINCINMNNQSTCNQTWTINATGEFDSSWLLYTIYDSDRSGVKTKETKRISLTIVEGYPSEVHSVECYYRSSWVNCSTLAYSNIIEQVRVNCTSVQGTITSASFELTNIPDNHSFFNNNGSYNPSSGYWEYDNSDVLIEDSGDWELFVTCRDDQSGEGTKVIQWIIPFGVLQPYLIDPIASMEVEKNRFFSFSSGVKCVGGGECGNIKSILDPTVPSLEWNKTFGGSDFDHGWSVQQTNDGGYIIAGYAHSFGSDDQAYLIKTDADGNEQWYKTFGGGWGERGYSVQQTSDNGYIITGITNTHSARVEDDIYLVKTDANGNEQWSKRFGGVDDDRGREVQQTSDGGYIIVGYTYSFGATHTDVYLIKTDSDGNKEWSKMFGGSLTDYGYSVQQTIDGGYIIAGETSSFGAGNDDVYLIKTDANGEEEWNKTFGGSNSDSGESVRQTSDNGYIIAGYTKSFGSNNQVYLIKTDFNGNQQWYKTFGGSDHDYGYSVKQTHDNGYIIAGYTYSFGSGIQLYLIKTDWLGNQQWHKTVGGSLGDRGYSVQQTSDNGYIVAGETNSFGSSAYDYDVYLVKIGTDPIKGIIPMNNGTPFYTIDQNPAICLNLKDGDSCNNTWQVNATGDLNSSYEFFTIYSPINYSGYISGDETSRVDITILGNVPPIIFNIQCQENNSIWTECSNIAYNDYLTGVRVNCTDADGVKSVSLRLVNVPDNHEFFNNSASFVDGYWIYDNSDILIQDSGEFNLEAYCTDNSDKLGNDIDDWIVPFGVLQPYLIEPLNDTTVEQYEFFDFSSGVSCIGGECGDVTSELDPIEGIIIFYDDFESGLGDWSNVGGDNFDWTRKSGSTPSSSTGPTSAHGGSYYVYTESSSPNYPNKVAILEGTTIDLDSYSDEKIEFWYHMYGSSMGSLYLEINDNSEGWIELWSKSGNQGNEWYNDTVDLSSYSGSRKLRFRMITGLSYTSDAALDDIRITSGGGKGIIPMHNGTPFYTTDQNPAICLNLKDGDSCNSTWQVNTTGDLNSSYEFFTIYSPINYSGYISGNKTEKVNITIVAVYPDSDGDGIPDSEDNCPYDYNPGQNNTDGDGIGDACDNCWYIDNPEQEDTNANCPTIPFTTDPECGDACESVCIDSDGDGYGVCPDCNVTNGCLYNGHDCNDNNASIYPGVTELCNSVDDDCDGEVDEGNPGGGLSCNTGLLGICSSGTTQCSAGAIICNQNQQPAVEICNGLDDDCDGEVDETGCVCYQNSDCGTDGFINGLFCQGNNVFQNYKTWTCNNPGTVSSSCTSSTVAQLNQTCLSNQICSSGQCITNQIPINIPLKTGWNLISIPLILENDSIESVFGDIMDKVIVINGFESGVGGGAKTYDPELPDFSDLHNIDYLHGYWVKMNESANLNIIGTSSEDKIINLAIGWNLISYLCDINKSVEEVFGNIMDKVIVINGFENGALTYDPQLPEFSDLQVMKSNYGYWVKMNQSAVLDYNSVC